MERNTIQSSIYLLTYTFNRLLSAFSLVGILSEIKEVSGSPELCPIDGSNPIIR